MRLTEQQNRPFIERCCRQLLLLAASIREVRPRLFTERLIRMIKKAKRRFWIRVASFSAAALVVLGAFSAIGFSAASRYRTTLELSYRRALEEISVYISNIENALNKGIYAASTPQIIGLSNKLFSECACAKVCLSQIPLDEIPVESIHKFISQTGDFANTLSRKVSSGAAITAEDYESLTLLADYAVTLNAAIQDVESELLNNFENAADITGYLDQFTPQYEQLARLAVNDGFRQMEEGFADYPTLIYDGPFSDHIYQQESIMLKDKREVSEQVAREAAANFRRGASSQLTLTNQSEGKIPTYTFSCADNTTCTLDVTIQGGIPQRMIDSRLVEETVLSTQQAIATATMFLQERGFASMKESYYSIANNIITINFAATEQGYTCYPDLIKVSVALDNGAVLMYDATGYIMNHTGRTPPAPKLTLADAQAKLSPHLTVSSSSQAIIPTSWKGESYCYEFHCVGRENQEVLVYINTQTGLEEQILILEKSDNGIFVM